MCELTVRAIVISGTLRLGGNYAACTSEYGKLTGMITCAEPAAWTLTHTFRDEDDGVLYKVTVPVCDRHLKWHFGPDGLSCEEHGEPFKIRYFGET